jgi:hypothetical protein
LEASKHVTATRSGDELACPALAKPLSAAVPLRVGPIQNLVPAGELRVIGVGKMLGDEALVSMFYLLLWNTY